jgi:putative hydrolase of the HAD superfamily
VSDNARGWWNDGMVTAVVFDFDGLILDTETPIFRSWAEAYEECGVAPLAIDAWASAIGTAGGFDPLAELSSRVAGADAAVRAALDDVLTRRKARRDALLALEAVRPGVVDWLTAAHRLGLGVGLASSSSRGWVEGHLRRLGVFAQFDGLVCFGDDAPGGAGTGTGGAGGGEQHVVAPHDGSAPGPPPGPTGPTGRMRPKPAPDLYLAVCEALGAAPAASVAIEDSPNGIRAARAAGMYCIAVPNPMTRLLRLEGAHLVVESLADISLTEALEVLTN